jgi:hypothetical protein
MKANKPSLILYFFACTVTLVLNLTGDYDFAVYSNAMVVPSIFIYYLVTNNYRISGIKSLIFLFCFIGEVYFLMDNTYTEITPIICFLLVNSLLLKYIIGDFKQLNFNKRHILQLLAILIFISTLFVAILNLKLEKLRFDFLFLVVYAMLLGILSVFSFAYFIVKPSYVHLNLTLMSICFIISDLFYVLNNFYLPLSTFKVIGNVAQVVSYFFMVNYFIGNDKSRKKSVVVL